MRKKSKPSLFIKTIKTLPVLFGVMAVFYLGLLVRAAEFPTVLPVTNVQVEGELKFLNEDEIKALVKKNISGGYFTVDLGYIREILSHESWVKNVSLRRKWPASLNVVIEEKVAVAYWNNDAYLSEKGDVFKPGYIDKKLNLPNLSGPAGLHDNVWKFMNILYKETAMLNYDVVRLNLDDRRAWQLVLAESADVEGESSADASQQQLLPCSDKSQLCAKTLPSYRTSQSTMEIKLGRFDTEKRLQRFVRILPALTIGQGIKSSDYAESKIRVIDMRYPNGFAVQLSEA